MRTRLLSPVLLAAALALAAAPVHAQQAATVRGQVVDAQTGQPLAGVTVELLEKGRRALTNSEGRFALRTTAGPTALGVQSLGYRPTNLVLDLKAGEHDTGVIRLETDPIVLEGITATVNRWETRRRAHGQSSQVVERREIVSGYAPDVATLVRTRLGLGVASCGPAATDCVIRRGRPARISVFMDEVPLPGGMSQLAAYQPDEIQRIELFGGQMVRVYTTGYLEWAARNNIKPMPIAVMF